MNPLIWLGVGFVVFVVLGGGLSWIVGRSRPAAPRPAELSRAKQVFARRREWLEAEFFTRASTSGKPRGLLWSDCDFGDGVTWARQRGSGQWYALVGVTVQFEAIPGGGMEDNPNVGNLRTGTALFRFTDGEWTTDGQVRFNLDPVQTIRHFQGELEAVEE